MASENAQVIELPHDSDSWLASLIYSFVKEFRYGELFFSLESKDYLIRGQQPGPRAEIHLHHPLAILRKVSRRGDIGLAESFMQGDWTSTDLAAFLCWGVKNSQQLIDKLSARGWVKFFVRLRHLLRANTKQGSKRNIAAHYDLGNDFYRLWLDQSMTYSSAVFADADMSLAAAQEHKYAKLLAALDAKPGARILEIGCGWGGFAEHAARQGMHVTGITLSKEQLAWAQECIAKAGLSDNVDLRLQDYRDLRETFDHVVSIEMFEAVGEKYWQSYFSILHKCLKPGGKAALQIITIDDAYFDSYRKTADFIQLYIFPGGMLPPLNRLHQLTSESGLVSIATSHHALDYARTLAYWQKQFDQAETAIRALGFDQQFLQMWRYYLAYCEAGFREGRIDLCQLIVQKPVSI
jgi:cyclopropane-fatty-acyl-phospholipid synthase